MDSADLEIEPAHLILVGVGAGAVVAWLLLFSVKFARMSRDSKGEIAMIKWCCKVMRVCIVVLLVAQVPLLSMAMSQTNPLGKTPIINGIPRPLVVLICLPTGFFVNSRTSMRFLFVVACISFIVMETGSEEELSCRANNFTASQRCDGQLKDYSTLRLQVQLGRDMLALTLHVWNVLFTAYIWVAIGCWDHRYHSKELDLSRNYGHQKLLMLHAAQSHQRNSRAE